MTELERQCEEISRIHDEGRFDQYGQHAAESIGELLDYIAELRRPSDAKEIQQIQDRHAEDLRMLECNPDLPNQFDGWESAVDIRTLLHCFAESQRNLAGRVQMLSFVQDELTQRNRENEQLKSILREVTPAIRDVLWCALVWNDHNHDFEDLTDKSRSAARALGYTNEVIGGGIDRANAWMQRVDAALASPLPADTRDDNKLCDEICAAIKAADDQSSDGGYMYDSDDCIRVVREYFAGLSQPKDSTNGTV